MGDLIEIFTYPFVIKAVICGISVSIAAALIGTVLVLKRYSMIGHGLGEVGFAALSLAVACNLSPLIVSVPLVIITAFAVMTISQKKGEDGDVWIALISAGALAIGIITTALTKGFNIDVSSYMFGSILAVSTSDVIVSALVSFVLVVLFVILYNRIFMVTFDESYAKARGTNVKLYQFVISFITAVVVVIGMRLMGTLLISGLIVFPAVIARKLTNSFKSMLIVSIITAIFCFVFGMALSFVINLPTGATIVVVYMLLLFVTTFSNFRRKNSR